MINQQECIIPQSQDWGQKLLDQPTNNDIKTYENIRKITAGQGYDFTTGCLLVSSYFKKVIRWLQ